MEILAAPSPFTTTLLVAAVVSAAAFETMALALRGPEDSFLVAHVRVLAWLHARVYFRLRVLAAGDPVPPKGSFIIVANHRSGADPMLLSVITRRKIRFLMAREYYETPVLHWLFRSLGCIPVNRDGKDLGATKAALRSLENGGAIGIFPQGGIREADAALDEGKSGAALLALKTGSPVIPFWIEGTPNTEGVFVSLIIPSRATIRCGKPVELAPPAGKKPSRTEIEEASDVVLRSILALRCADGEDTGTGEGAGETSERALSAEGK